MNNVVILNSSEIGMNPILFCAIAEFCQAFLRKGYNLTLKKNIHDIKNDDIIIMGNDINVINPVNLLYNLAPDATYIGWYWQDYDTSILKNFIHTGENMLHPSVNYIERHNKLINKSYIPLLLRANDDPSLIGTYKKNICRDFIYIGYPYKEDWKPSNFNGLYYGCTFQNFLSYEQRRDLYLSSVFCLGFQSDDNILNGHVSQRIYEGLAYGCIVLTNSKPAVEQTDNICILVNSKEEIENIMDFYLKNQNLIIDKQNKGYDFIKLKGTNHFAIDLFEKQFKTFTNITI